MESPSQPPRRRRGIVRRCERACWWTLIRIPLVLVYSLTTWAVWVATGLCLKWRQTSLTGTVLLVLVSSFYVLLNWSYTVTAFTNPGSPLNPPSPSRSSQHAYSELPTHETDVYGSSITVKSGGGERFCKKCQARKPDRAHHCSTCRRCVLKMDHHCPWIATCVGLRNYKAFILFCTYVTLFCWTCFAISISYLYKEFHDFTPNESDLSVNMVLLAVLAGIFGIVMTGFTSWHYHLALNNQTTIEKLEKTRYLGTLQKKLETNSRFPGDIAEGESLMQKYGEQLREMHANAIPGVTRVEEGEERRSPSDVSRYSAASSSHADMDWRETQRERERQRYESYLDEQDSEQLPNAFDLGWKKNMSSVFGSNPLVWPFPFGTATGDGFRWTPNPTWVRAREGLRQQREVRWKEQEARERKAGWGVGARYPVDKTSALDESHMESGGYLITSDGLASVPGSGSRSLTKADRLLGRVGMYADDVPLATIGKGRRGQDDEEDSASLEGLYDGSEGEN